MTPLTKGSKGAGEKRDTRRLPQQPVDLAAVDHPIFGCPECSGARSFALIVGAVSGRPIKLASAVAQGAQNLRDGSMLIQHRTGDFSIFAAADVRCAYELATGTPRTRRAWRW